MGIWAGVFVLGLAYTKIVDCKVKSMGRLQIEFIPEKMAWCVGSLG